MPRTCSPSKLLETLGDPHRGLRRRGEKYQPKIAVSHSPAEVVGGGVISPEPQLWTTSAPAAPGPLADFKLG